MGHNKRIIYSHSGDIGDIIYSLSLVKYTGCDDFIICSTPGPQRVQIEENLYRSIHSLLSTQSYIKNVHFYKGSYETPMRKFRHWVQWFGIAESHFYAYGHSMEDAKNFLRRSSWLECKATNNSKKVIVNRTNRYIDNSIDFSILKDFKSSDIGFVGTRQEYEDFLSHENIEIEYIETINLLDLTSTINSCQLFVGNSSSPAAIAQALCKPSIIYTLEKDKKAIELNKETSIITSRQLSEFDKWIFFSKFNLT